MPEKRKICFVITSPTHYGRSIFILEELKKRDDVDLHIILGGTALLPKYTSKYARVEEILKRGGYNIHPISFNVEGDEPVNKAKTAGLAAIEFAALYNEIKPDLIVVRGDRFETLGAALSASNMNISIAHIEGGDVTGTIDEAIRHSITKLAQIHFVTNEKSKTRVLRMGEKPDYVFNFGSPDVDVAAKLADGLGKEPIDLSQIGSGAELNLNNAFLMVMFHPVSTEIDKLAKRTRTLFEAIRESGIQTLWFWPNFDAGAEEISHKLRILRDKPSRHKIHFTRYLTPQLFLALLNKTKCLIGNSSANIKEASYLGVPAVNIGTRQNGRLRAENVVDVSFNKEEIKQAIDKQSEHGKYEQSKLYFREGTSQNIAQKLATVDLYIQKQFYG